MSNKHLHNKLNEGPKINQSFKVVNGKSVAESAEKHPAWMELLFDLVIIVAFSKLVHAFESDIGHDKATAPLLYAVKFLSIYVIWQKVDFYANRFGQMESIWDFVIFFSHFSSLACICVTVDALGSQSEGNEKLLALREFCIGVAFSQSITIIAYLRVAYVLEISRGYVLWLILCLSVHVIFYTCAALSDCTQHTIYILISIAVLFDLLKEYVILHWYRKCWPFTYIPLNSTLSKERVALLVLIAIGEQIATISGTSLKRRIYTGTLLACLQGFLFKWAYFDVFDCTGEITETPSRTVLRPCSL
jgi:low temperature requirement protein LtrA